MKDKFNIHTDLAVENKERFQGDDTEISGVKVYEKLDERYGVKLTKVEITSPKGANIMGKPMGKYVTIETTDIGYKEYDLSKKKQLGKVLARELFYMLPVKKKEEIKELSVLVVGLGNKDVTPDSLGPYVVANLEVTRHIFMLKNNYSKSKGISAMLPGVMAQSGMESAEMVEGIVKQIKPDVVICIDALAAGSTKRLSSTIQLADTGINPGAGIGNHRKGINRANLGIPVIAIGIPTVIHAATIVSDTMDEIIKVISQLPNMKGEGCFETLKSFSDNEKHKLVRELLEPNILDMFVTPKDIDESIRFMSETLAYGINLIFSLS